MVLVRALMSICFAIAGATAASAADGAAIGVVVENDVLAGSDRDYTSGVKLAYVFPEGRHAGFARVLLGARDDDRTRLSLGAGQNLYTPEFYGVPSPPAGQHPYAGWLYADASLIVERRGGAVVDFLGASIGVVGPAALGEPTQRTLHRITNDIEPLGWDNQLRNEPGVALSFDRQWRAFRDGAGKTEFEIAPFAGASAGNILTEARAGMTLRIGSGLAQDFGPLRVRSSIPSGGFGGRGGFSWSIFAGAAARAVARNIFLDGGTWRDSASVDKKALVGEFQAGLTMNFGKARLSYTQVLRTRQYETEPERHGFGAVSLSASF